MRDMLIILIKSMDPFSDDQNDKPIILNRSCNEKIENDSINAPSSDCTNSFQLRLTKSERQLGEIDELGILEVTKKNWKTDQVPKSDDNDKKEETMRPKIVLNRDQSKRMHPDFGTDILDSESVSIDEEYMARYEGHEKILEMQKNQENSHKNQENRHRNSTRSNYTKLNILLVGRSGVGKTSFIDSFCDKNYQAIPVIRQKTEAMKVHTYEDTIQYSTVEISLIDFPGFQETNIEEYIENVNTMIQKGFERRFKQKKNGQGNGNGNGSGNSQNNGGRNGSNGSGNRNETGAVQDERIHCCLFFISGPWVNESQWLILKKLQQKTNIIPLIAKGDTFTTAQIKHFKKKIQQKNRIQNINLLSLQEIIRQNYPQKLNRLINGAFGKSPPFVITCCTEKIYDEKTKNFELARNYKWGQMKLDSDEHNDFRFLKQLLTECLGEVLIKHTDVMEKRYIELKKRQNMEMMISSNSDITPININLSQRLERSQSSEILQNKEQVNFMQYIKIGLTVVAVAAFFFLAKDKAKSK